VLCVALPFCAKDAVSMLDTLKWMGALHGSIDFNAVLVFPSSLQHRFVEAIDNIARVVFAHVEKFSYPCPANSGWPLGPNLAWQSTARRMLAGASSWLWLEADAIPLKSDWLKQLDVAYAQCGKAFMGAIVPHMGHCNGVAIYPPDTASRCPKAMVATNQAWDYVMRDEMIADCHDASDLIFHFWGLINDRPHATTGNPPHFKSIADVKRWIPDSTVLMHRCKDGSLIKRLNESLNLDRKLDARPTVA